MPKSDSGTTPFEQFVDVTRRIINVPHDEIKRKIISEKNIETIDKRTKRDAKRKKKSRT